MRCDFFHKLNRQTLIVLLAIFAIIAYFCSAFIMVQTIDPVKK